MGAVMAPAAADTLKSFLELTNTSPDDYDLIVTGDLGARGNELCKDILKSQGIELKENFKDCGMMIFDPIKQDVHCGGSGCGCSASVFGGYLFKRLKNKEIKKLLLMGTGALMSPLTVFQKESIAGICHLVSMEGVD
jgi:stage V sporulation protein AD